MDADDWTQQSEIEAGTSKFIILDSQEEQDAIEDWPALQIPMADSESNNNLLSAKPKSKRLSLIADLSEEERKLEDSEVLVPDSEFEGSSFVQRHRGSNGGYRLPSDAEEVISDSEDQGNETVVEKRDTGDAKSATGDDGNKSDLHGDKGTHSSNDSSFSFHSNSQQGLGSYQQAEMSHTGQEPSVHGNRFKLFQESLSQDIFQDKDGDDHGESLTPSEFIGSLQLSNQPMLVPETLDEDENEIIQSTGPYIPSIIPSTPTGEKTTESDDEDVTIFITAADSTFADNIPAQQHQSLDESVPGQDSSGKSDGENVTVKEVLQSKSQSRESGDYVPDKVKTLVTDNVSTCGESLHLHYTATESHSRSPQQKDESLVLIDVEEKKEDSVIIISFDEGNDQTEDQETQKSTVDKESDVIGSQELVLHLTPSQYSKENSQKGGNLSQGPGQRSTHSQEGIEDAVEKTKSSSHSDSAGFHLSLPKEGTLLHPVEISPPAFRQKPATPAVESSHDLSPPHTSANQDTGYEHRPSPVKVPSLTINMIDTQTAMSDPMFTLQRPEMHSDVPELSEDRRFDVFRQKKGAGKLAKSPSRRNIIYDGSDDQSVPVHSGEKRKQEDSLSPRSLLQQQPQMKRSRTMSSEVTSTGYMASVEGTVDMDTNSPTEHMEVQEEPEDVMMAETETYDASVIPQILDISNPSDHPMAEVECPTGQELQPLVVTPGPSGVTLQGRTPGPSGVTLQGRIEIVVGGVDVNTDGDRRPFQKVSENTHRQTPNRPPVTKDISLPTECTKESDQHCGKTSTVVEDISLPAESTKDSNRRSSKTSSVIKDISLLAESTKEGGKHSSRKSKLKGRKGSKGILKKQSKHEFDLTGISDRPKSSPPPDPYTFHGSQSQMITAVDVGSTVVPETVTRHPAGIDQQTVLDQQGGPSGSKVQTTPTSSRKKWSRTVHKKSGVKRGSSFKKPRVSFDNSVKNKSTPPKVETPLRHSINEPAEQEQTRRSVIGQLFVRSPAIGQSASMVVPTSMQTTAVTRPRVITTTTTIAPSTSQVVPDTAVPICPNLSVGSLSTPTAQPQQQETIVTKTVERTWICKSKEITQTVRDKDGRAIRTSTRKEEDTPKLMKEVTTETSEIIFVTDMSLSPSRSNSTMTSGDLADVSSSMSRSSSSGSRQNLASLEVMVGSLPSLSKSPDMDYYFTPPEPVAFNERRTKTGERSDQSKQDAGTNVSRRHSTQPSDIDMSPHEGDISTINKTGSDMEISHLTEEKRNSESLFTSSADECRKVAEAGKSAVESNKMEEDVSAKVIVLTSDSSDAIPCAQRVFKVTEESSEGCQDRDGKDTVAMETESGGTSRPVTGRPKRRSASGSRSSDLSPQIPYQDVAQARPDSTLPSTPPVTGRAIKSDTVVGGRVLARWKDGFFYPGSISQIIRSKYQVRFDDGDLRFVKVNDLLLIERLPVGQSVMVLGKGGFYEPGIITDHKSPTKASGQFHQYVVEQDSGKSAPFRCSQVILSEDQAKCLVTDTGLMLPTSPLGLGPPTTPKTADVSLDNLMDCKRRNISRYEQQDLVKEDAQTTSTSKAAVPVPSTSSSVKQKRGRVVTADPVATSTPTPNRQRGTDLDASPVGAAVSSPVMPRRSPRKVRIGLFHTNRGAKPSQKLFRGIIFLLTHVEKSAEQKEEERRQLGESSLEVSTDESSSQDEPAIPFDKNLLRSLIEAGGGVLLDKYNKEQVSSARQCILLSDTYQRTVKYFQFLAAGLLSLSHVWVHDCCSEDELLDQKAYMLQAGISLEKKRVMEWKPACKLLADMTVLVESQNARFKEEWTTIVEIAGAEVETKIQTRDYTATVVVTDSSCPNTVLRRAKQLSVPVVSTEWIIQSLINSQRVAYNGHPRYQHDYTKDSSQSVSKGRGR